MVIIVCSITLLEFESQLRVLMMMLLSEVVTAVSSLLCTLSLVPLIDCLFVTIAPVDVFLSYLTAHTATSPPRHPYLIFAHSLCFLFISRQVSLYFAALYRYSAAPVSISFLLVVASGVEYVCWWWSATEMCDVFRVGLLSALEHEHEK